MFDSKSFNETKIEEFTGVLRDVVPELKDFIQMRYNILNTIKFKEPIGRRSLASCLNTTERVVRREAQILKEQELIEFTLEGMKVTEKGMISIESLNLFFFDVKGLYDLERELEQHLGIKRVIISASSEDRDLNLKEIGYSAAKLLKNMIEPHDVIGITGGTNMEAMVDGFKPEWANKKDKLLIVPARGGLGNKTEYQANTLVQRLAEKTDAEYRTLYMQDNLSVETIDRLKHEPDIKSMLDTLETLDILVFGIGSAPVMAERRSLSKEKIDEIIKRGAVAEAFGYYFNKQGEIVHEIFTIGIRLETVKRLEKLIAIAKGTEKAEAIEAISKLNPNLILVTDESVARRILNK